MVFLTGRLSWSTVSTSTAQVLVTGLDYACTYPTGVAVSQDNMRNTNSQRHGISMTIESGHTYFKMWRMQGEEDPLTFTYDRMKAPGFLDINIMYYSSAVPQ